MNPFENLLSLEEDEIDCIKTALIHINCLPSDVLDEIADNETFTDETVNGNSIGEKIYAVDILKESIDREDVNEATKCKIEALYEKLKTFDYFLVAVV